MYHISAVFFTCVIIGCMIIAIVPPSGASGIALTYGFIHVMTSLPHILLILAIAISFLWIRGVAWSLIPMTSMLCFLGSSFLVLYQTLDNMITGFIIGTFLILALLYLMIGSGRLLLMAIITNSYAFHLSRYGIIREQAETATLYYIIGQVTALGLMLGGVACLLFLFSSGIRYTDNTEE